MNDRILFYRKIYHIIYICSLLLAGICLMAGCLVIYKSGLYSREVVAETLSKIAVPLWLFLILTVGNIAWELISPTPPEKPRPDKDRANILHKLYQSRSLDGCDETIKEQIRTLHRDRRKRKLILFGAIAAFTLLIALWVFLFVDFDNHDKAGMITAILTSMYVLLPGTAGIMIMGYRFSVADIKSLDAEITAVKSIPTLTCEASDEVPVSTQEQKLLLIRIGILAASVVFIVFGIANNGVADVLAKAVQICTECIGLG